MGVYQQESGGYVVNPIRVQDAVAAADSKTFGTGQTNKNSNSVLLTGLPAPNYESIKILMPFKVKIKGGAAPKKTVSLKADLMSATASAGTYTVVGATGSIKTLTGVTSASSTFRGILAFNRNLRGRTGAYIRVRYSYQASVTASGNTLTLDAPVFALEGADIVPCT